MENLNERGEVILEIIEQDNFIIKIVQQDNLEKNLDGLYRTIAELLYEEIMSS